MSTSRQQRQVLITRTETGRRLEIPFGWYMDRVRDLVAAGWHPRAAWAEAIEHWLEREDAMAKEEETK